MNTEKNIDNQYYLINSSSNDDSEGLGSVSWFDIRLNEIKNEKQKTLKKDKYFEWMMTNLIFALE